MCTPAPHLLPISSALSTVVQHRRARHAHDRKVAARLVVLALVGSLVLAVAACGGGSDGLSVGSGPGLGPQMVIFAPSVTYEQALRTVTDLGMQPGLNCDEGWEYSGQRDQFAITHGLIVVRSYASLAPDWGTRLEASPDVVSIQEAREAPPAGTPAPTGGPFAWYVCPTPTVVVAGLTSAQAGTYAQVAFGATQSYDDALYMVSNLGLQLVDPCYEQALLAQKSPPWHAMGQESSFAATHALVVETRIGITPATWQQLLSASAGVTSVVTPYAAPCS